MSGSGTRKAAGLGFEHRAEGVVAQGSLLLQMKAHVFGKHVVGQASLGTAQ